MKAATRKVGFTLAAVAGFTGGPREAAADDASTCVAAHEKAQELRASGALGGARRELARCATRACPALVADDCIAWAAEVDAEMRRLEEAPDPQPTRSTPTAAPPVAPATAPSAPAPSRVPTATWVLGGVGLAGLATFGVAGAMGKSRYDALAGSCAPSCDPSDAGSVRTAFVAADVGLAVGAASLAAAVVTYFVLRDRAPEPRSLARGVTLAF